MVVCSVVMYGLLMYGCLCLCDWLLLCFVCSVNVVVRFVCDFVCGGVWCGDCGVVVFSVCCCSCVCGFVCELLRAVVRFGGCVCVFVCVCVLMCVM